MAYGGRETRASIINSVGFPIPIDGSMESFKVCRREERVDGKREKAADVEVERVFNEMLVNHKEGICRSVQRFVQRLETTYCSRSKCSINQT